MSEIRVMIVADDLLARTGLAALLGEQAGVRVVGVGHPAQAAEDSDLLQPDVMVWDMGWHGCTLAAVLAVGWPTLALVGEGAALALPGGDARTAFAVLPRDCTPAQMGAALRALSLGLTVFAPGLLARATPAGSAPAAMHEPLTAREQEVLALLAQGLTNKAIALRLDITEHTVKFHVNAIMTKLNAQSRTDAVIRATRAGLVVL